MPHLRWHLPPPLPPGLGNRFPRAPRCLLQALYTRGLVDETDAGRQRLQAFLNHQLADPDPFELRDMDRAVERILREVDAGAPIGVFGHYDCDGVTSTALVCEALARLGATAIPHIPSRSDDYGIPLNGVERLHRLGVRLVVTVDCGIKAFAEVDAAAAMGVDIAITDHHECEQTEAGERLPGAHAVINPKRADCGYGFQSLAGVGVAYRLSQALAAARPGTALDDGGLEALLDLVCLGTVADVVSLVGENRRLVARGLERLRKPERAGIRVMSSMARLNTQRLSARDVGFVLAPRLNAAARLEHGVLSLDLLRAGNEDEAAPLAARLEELNRVRRQMTQDAVAAASELLVPRLDQDLVLVAVGRWLSGISGLVASQLKERFGRPVLAISDPEGGTDPDTPLVGSARSVPGVDISQVLCEARQELVRFGGHPGAAGFTVRRGRLEPLREQLNDFVRRTVDPDVLGPQLSIDAVLHARELEPALAGQLARFEPCGQGNPPMMLLIEHAQPLPGSLMTWEGDRFTLRLRGPVAPIKVSGGGEELQRLCLSGEPISLVCTASEDPDTAARIRLNIVDGMVGSPAPPRPVELAGVA